MIKIHDFDISHAEEMMTMPTRPVYQHQDLPFPTHPRVWAAINTQNLIHNYKILSACTPSAVPICVVKADAYGHSTALVVPALMSAGCRFFATATLEEALSLRSLLRRITPMETPSILVLGYTHPDDVAVMAENSIMVACVSYDHAKALSEKASEAGVTVWCHVAIDTGMNRIGLVAQDDHTCRQAAEDVMSIMDMDGLRVTGMFTHFSTDDFDSVKADGSYTHTQISRYMAVYDVLCQAGKRPAFCHVCNSVATIRWNALSKKPPFDGVRLGISLYGYGETSPTGIHLKPVMRLATKIVHLHTCPAHGKVGYGGEYAPSTPRTIATLPVGYADGFERGFKGGMVTVHTANGLVQAPLVGRICMDQCMIDVTDLPVTVGDEVTLFGDDTAELEALCRGAGTIPYEPLCLISGRVPRVETSLWIDCL